jgi:hypothetical protein
LYPTRINTAPKTDRGIKFKIEGINKIAESRKIP